MSAIARRPTCQQDAAEPAVPPDPRTRRYACNTCGPATPDVEPQDWIEFSYDLVLQDAAVVSFNPMLGQIACYMMR